MRKMRDSGIEWVRAIPQNWQLSKIGSLYTQRNEKVSDKDYQPLSVTMQGILPQLSTAAKTNDGDNRKLVRVGDFAINSRSDRRGSCGISPLDGSVSLINIILTPRTAMHPGYYNWLFHTTLFADEFYKWGHGIVADLWTTRWQEMKSITVPVPEYAEQERIAAFLDAECAEIDTVLEKTRASIEEYKKLKQAVITQAVTKGIRGDRPMKDSGIEWIGEIPAEWTASKIKYCTEFAPSCNTSHLSEDSLVTFTPMECIKNGYFENREAHFSALSSSYTQYQDGDIVFAKVTPCFENGNIAIMQGLSAGVGFGSSELFVIRPQSINTEFIFYYLQNDIFKQYACATMTGTGGLKRVSPTFVRNYSVFIPCNEEQLEIVRYLNEKCSGIEVLIAKKQQYLTEIENYKKSLIYEYVTGKKEVKTSVLAD
jgi:type I restriction enzyme S subunit